MLPRLFSSLTIMLMVATSLVVALPGIALADPDPSIWEAPSRFILDTGHNISGPFLRLYEVSGGLGIFGYPRTEAFEENGRVVQYFQRGRMEWWPENPEGSQVQLMLIGLEALGGAEPPIPANLIPDRSDPNQRYLPETGHVVSLGFLEYFERHGGVAVFGYPITEERKEGGYTVQYFQRARMEWHPENPSPYQVLLGLLGDAYIAAGRVAPARMVPVEPKPEVVMTTAVDTVITETRTNYVGMPERMYNIELAAQKLDGLVIPPGGEFSFNRSLGPVNRAAGFQLGFVISGNETVLGDGGGICQVSTTIFQAAFYAGYPILERFPHAYRIWRYEPPVGLDATVSDWTDLRFVNDGPGPITLRLATDGTYLSVAILGDRPGWDVEVGGPSIDRVIRTDPTPIYRNDSALARGRTIQAEAAADGMRVTIIRRVSEQGQIRHEQRFVSDYRPAHNVYVVGTGSPS
ncbi:MAG: VanW family protein [Chloroflexi bacterium]|nr:VanW family protein [Chloroflexota bacterium]